jgi:hypothetical protein
VETGVKPLVWQGRPNIKGGHGEAIVIPPDSEASPFQLRNQVIISRMMTRILAVAVLVLTLATPAFAQQKKAESSSDGLDDLMGALGGGKRETALEEGGSSHSIRGLSAASGGKGATKPEAESSVKSMESFSVNAEDIKKFQKDGGLK